MIAIAYGEINYLSRLYGLTRLMQCAIQLNNFYLTPNFVRHLLMISKTVPLDVE